MRNARPFVAVIRDSPDDDSPRLIFEIIKPAFCFS
jgi:hypothetical protein